MLSTNQGCFNPRHPPSSIMASTGWRFLLLPVAVCLLGIYLGWPQHMGLPTLQSVFSNLGVTSVAVHDAAHQITYTGTVDGGVEIFQNIFYAQDTSGANRFKPPVPIKLPPGSTVDGTAPGAMCPQAKGDAAFPFTSPTTNTSENCLSLKMGRPRGRSRGAKLPVLVYLHGGGAILGSGGDQLYRPHGIIRQSVANGQPVIFVGVNYRLGLFGFAASGALKKEKSMNNGLRDQRAALEWIKSNIDAFGGDPDRVTAVGQSVGAADIALHMASYAGKKGVPFERAM
jgi:carboxylesterase type B